MDIVGLKVIVLPYWTDRLLSLFLSARRPHSKYGDFAAHAQHAGPRAEDLPHPRGLFHCHPADILHHTFPH